MDNDPDDSQPITSDERRAATVEAIKDMVEAGKKLEKAAWHEGFYAGWYAAVEHMTKNAAAAAQRGPAADIQPTEKLQSPPEPPQKTWKPKDLVLGVIMQRPGLRGVDIVTHLKNADTEVHERTVRTALHRLKRAGKIKVVNGRWYSADVQAPQGHHALHPMEIQKNPSVGEGSN